MFGGIYSANMEKNARISDIGGHKVLNMGGSLNSYIRTGNPYSSAYYANKQKEKVDEFVNKEKRTKKDGLIEKAIIALGAAAGLFGLFKGKTKISNSIKNFRITKIPQLFAKPFKFLGGKISGLAKKIFKKGNP